LIVRKLHMNTLFSFRVAFHGPRLPLDLFHFEQLNDAYGRPVGDDCLRGAAQVSLSIVLRDTDLVSRYGARNWRGR
jgi:diguanylate cyclase (GGDEF)-like protein